MAVAISHRDLLRARMRSQLLAPTGTKSGPAEVAAWFAAMQAQDLASGLWSFGVRLPGCDAGCVQGAVQRGEVLRTWAMRGTIHFVAAADAAWLLALVGAKAVSTASARWRSLGLDAATAERAVEVWRAALTGGRRLTRSAMLAQLRAAGIETTGQRGYHLLAYASRTGVTCIGPDEGREQSFALLREWAPQQHGLSGEEALAELALRYFRSHGPTTRQDLMGWSRVSAAQARAGIAAAGDALVEVVVDGTTMIAAPEAMDAQQPEPAVRLLPGFDEYMLGYKDRTWVVPPGRMDGIVPGGNGVFRPTVVADGSVIGTWSRKQASGRTALVIDYFDTADPRVRAGVELAAQEYGRFLGTPVSIG